MIDQRESTFHLSETKRRPDGKEIKTDFDCTPDGKMRLSEDGKLMNVDFIPMVGSEQPGKLVFEKQ